MLKPTRRTDGGMLLDDAIEYAKNLQEDTNIMLDPNSGLYHVIRYFAVDHWLQYYKNIAEVRCVMTVTMLDS